MARKKNTLVKLLDLRKSFTLSGLFSPVVLSIVGLFVMLVVLAMYLSSRRRQQSEVQCKRARAWHLLKVFRGSLFGMYRWSSSVPTPEPKLTGLRDLATSRSDTALQQAAMTAITGVLDLARLRAFQVVESDMRVLLSWLRAPAIEVSSRMPLLVALIAMSPLNRARMGKFPSTVRILVGVARAASKKKQLYAVLSLGVLCREKEHAPGQLLECGVIEVLCTLSSSHDVVVRRAVAWLLARLSLIPLFVRELVSKPALRAIVSLLRSTDAGTQASAAFAVAQLATHSTLRDELVAANVVPYLIRCTAALNVSTQAMSTSALRSLTAMSPDAKAQLKKACSNMHRLNPDLLWQLRAGNAIAAASSLVPEVLRLSRSGQLGPKEAENILSALRRPGASTAEWGEASTSSSGCSDSEGGVSSDNDIPPFRAADWSASDGFESTTGASGREVQSDSTSLSVTTATSATTATSVSVDPPKQPAAEAVGLGLSALAAATAAMSGSASALPASPAGAVVAAAAAGALVSGAAAAAAPATAADVDSSDHDDVFEDAVDQGTTSVDPHSDAQSSTGAAVSANDSSDESGGGGGGGHSGGEDAPQPSQGMRTAQHQQHTPRRRRNKKGRTQASASSASSAGSDSERGAEDGRDGAGSSAGRVSNISSPGSGATSPHSASERQAQRVTTTAASTTAAASASPLSSPTSPSATLRHESTAPTASTAHAAARKSTSRTRSGPNTPKRRDSVDSLDTAREGGDGTVSDEAVSPSSSMDAFVRASLPTTTAAAATAATTPSAIGGKWRQRAHARTRAGERREHLALGLPKDFLYRHVCSRMEAIEENSMHNTLSTEALQIMECDIFFTMLDLAAVELPALLAALRETFSAVNFRPDQDESAGLVAICRPVEAQAAILKALCSDALRFSVEIRNKHRQRNRAPQPSLAVRALRAVWPDRPLSWAASLLFASLNKNHRTRAGAEADDARVFQREPSLCTTISLQQFQEKFFLHYPPMKAVRRIPRSGKPALVVSKQFARDVPSMVRINGVSLAAETDDQLVAMVVERLLRAADGSQSRVDYVTSFANQNLGIYLYEQLVNKYKADPEMVVLQDASHFVDIQLQRRTGITIVMHAKFRVQSWSVLDSLGSNAAASGEGNNGGVGGGCVMYRGRLKLSLRKKRVKIVFERSVGPSAPS